MKQNCIYTEEIFKIDKIIFRIFLIVFFIFYSSLFCFSQKSNSDLYYSPEGIFDQVLDDKGNIYKLVDIEAGKSIQEREGVVFNTLICSPGVFELYFETGSGMEIIGDPLHDQRRAILCQAFQDISDFINTPLKNIGNNTKLKFWIRNPNSLSMPAQAAAAASGFYNLPVGFYNGNGVIGGIVDNEVWKTIQTGVDSYSNTVFPVTNTEISGGFYHGWAVFNFSGIINWNLHYNKVNSSTGFLYGDVDLYTTVIHEIIHALGLQSLLDHSGNSRFYSTNNGVFGRYYTRYDKFLKTNSNSSLISNNYTPNSGQMYNFMFNFGISQNVLRPSCSLSPPVFNGNSGFFNCPTSLKYVGSLVLPLYTPNCFEPGSSLSHFEDACYNGNINDDYFMMSERSSANYAKRFLSSEERQVLCDIGYSLNSTFGNTSNFTFKDYNTTVCNGIGVAGVNDGFTSTGYAFEGNSGEEINISGILNNDYTGGSVSNLRFEFVQDMYDPNAIFSADNGDNMTNFTIKSYIPGLHLLRYVPYDNSTGKRGNITYIYVNVLNNCNTSSVCDLVSNGDFEEHYYSPTGASQIFKACGWQNASYRATSDYFNSDSTTNEVSVPCNFWGYQIDKVAGNNAYAGMFIQPNRYGLLQNTYSESIKTELINSLQVNTEYQLSFNVSLSEGNSNRSIKFQAFITDTNLELTTGGIIPTSSINSNTVFLTNSNFSNSSAASVDGWETITFNFTTGNNPNLKYLYIGGLNNVQFQNEAILTIPSSCTIAQHTPNITSYYYVDNVKLIELSPSVIIEAVDDNFTSTPVDSTTGGVTPSVYGNDLYNDLPSSSSNISNIIFSLVDPVPIAGASINNMGLIYIPPNTPIGNYTLTYQAQILGSCLSVDTASVNVYVSDFTLTPNLSSAIRADHMVNFVEVLNTGKIIIAGKFRNYNNISRNTLARLNSDLTLDTSFSSSGPNPSSNPPMGLVLQADNRIIVTGWFSGFSGGSNGYGLARLLPNGSFDSSYNVGGTGVAEKSGYTGKKPYTCAIQNDGKVLIGGDFWYYNGVKRLGIVRLKTDGSIDLTFNPVELNNDYYRSVVTGIAIQEDGNILLSGNFSSSLPGVTYKNLIRLESNGNLDHSFTMGDLTNSTPYYNLGSSLYSPIANMTLLSDGKIIVYGGFDRYNGMPVNNIIRLMSSGNLDSSFNFSNSVNRVVYSVIVEPSSNKLLIGGEFETFDGQPVKKLIRLNPDGDIDSTFNIGNGTFDSQGSTSYAYNNVRVLKKQPDGKVIVGGKFTMFNDITAGNITRIYGDVGIQAKSSSIEYISEPEIDINFEDNISDVLVYPNPSKDNFIFDLTQDKYDFNNLVVFNLLGVKVFEVKVNPKELNTLNLAHLPKGYYLAYLVGNAQSKIIKLIKN